jgi:hypothetical protein
LAAGGGGTGGGSITISVWQSGSRDWIAELSLMFGFLKRTLVFLKLNLACQFGFSKNANLSAAISNLGGDCGI